MADRHLAAAAASVVAALVVAAGALVTVAMHEPPTPPSTVVTLPAPPAPATATDAASSAAAEGVAEVDDEPAASEEGGAGAAGGEEAAAPLAADEEIVAAPATPARLVVVATGIAWNDDLAAAAAFRLPSAVAFALPADLPTAVERLARWRAAGRGVVLRLAWRAAPTAEGDVVPLDGPRARQAGGLEAQVARLDADAAAIVEPHAAAALAEIARSVDVNLDAPLLRGSAEPAPPPRAWRLDAGLSGERGFEAALQRIVDGTVAGETLVVLIEIYPALLDRVVTWLRGLEEHGIALVPLDALVKDGA